MRTSIRNICRGIVAKEKTPGNLSDAAKTVQQAASQHGIKLNKGCARGQEAQFLANRTRLPKGTVRKAILELYG